MTLAATAEHEAAHAVVARHLGLAVHQVHVDPRTLAGRTVVEPATPGDTAVVLIAGDLWARHFSTHPYPDRSCSDLARFETEHGFTTLWAAERQAHRILTTRQDAVRALAARLTREHHIEVTS
jgi:hypothetical protein